MSAKMDEAMVEQVAKACFYSQATDRSWENCRAPEEWRRMARDAVAAFRRALAEKGWCVERDWQPIETAPRDGTHVMTWLPEDRSHEILYLSGDAWFTVDGYALEDTADPTHWRNLPAPPSAAEG